MINASIGEVRAILEALGITPETVYLGFVKDEDFPEDDDGKPNGRNFHALTFEWNGKKMAWAEQHIQYTCEHDIVMHFVDADQLKNHEIYVLGWQ